MARERELNFKLNVKQVNADAMKTAFRGVTQELDKQQQKADKIKDTLAGVKVPTSKPVPPLPGLKVPTGKAMPSLLPAGFTGRLPSLALPAAGQGKLPFALPGLGQTGKTALSALGGGMKGIGGMIAGGGPGAALSGLGGSLGSLAGVAGPAGMAITAVAAAVSGLAKAAISLGGAASPVALQRYELALADTQAVLGRIFVPLLEHMGDAMRLVGDVLASVLPSTAEMRDATEPFRDALKDLKAIFTDLAPAIKIAIKGMLVIQKALWKIAMTVGLFQIRAAAAVAKATGALPANKQGLKSSVGASGRRVDFVGLEEYAKQVYKAAAAGGTQSVEEKMSQDIGIIAEVIQRIADYIGAGKKAADTAKGVASQVPNVLGMAYDPAGSVINALRGAIQRGLTGQ